MTVEIAAINRVAVALATDSAVTVQRGHDAKVYQSENKLFELSKQKPAGIMIYNNMEYFGIPWEIIIKDFRSKHGHEPADHLFEWQDRFLTFVQKRFKPTSQMEVENLSQLISDWLMRILEEFDRQRIITWQKVGQDVSVASIEHTLLEQFQKIFDTEIEHLNADGETESILQHSVDRFLATNKEFLEREARRNFPRFPLTPVESDLLTRIMHHI